MTLKSFLPMIYERKLIMKKNVVKLIALSMLPLSLMSFKGNEEVSSLSVTTESTVGRNIKKAYTPTFDTSKISNYDFNTAKNIESLLEVSYGRNEDGVDDFTRTYYGLKLNKLWGLPEAKNKEFAVLALVRFDYDPNTERKNPNFISNYRKFTWNDLYVADSSTGQKTINLIPFGAEGEIGTGDVGTDLGNPTSQWDAAYVFFVDDPNVLNDGESKEVYVNVDSPTTLDQIKEGIHLQNVFGTDLPVEYKVKEGSSEYNPSKLGTYSYTISGSSNGQTSTATLNIIVKDITAPTIENPTQVSIPYSQGLKVSDFEGKFTASDNATDKGGTIEEIMYFVGDTQIDKDHPYTLTAEQIKAHKINITVKVQDSSGNEGTGNFDVLLTDDKAPEILVNGNPVGEGAKFKTALKTFSNAEAAKQAFLAGFTASDEYDAETPVVEVVDFPNLDNVRVGDNEVTLSAVDKAGNRKNLKVIVEVTNDQLPVFIFDDFLISATSNNPLTADQITTLIADHLYETTNTVVSNEDIRVASSFYEENAKRPGRYTVQYTYKQPDGNYSDAQSVDVLVSGANETSWWDDFTKSMSDFFQRLGNWFTGKGFKTNAEIHDEEILSQGKEE